MKKKYVKPHVEVLKVRTMGILCYSRGDNGPDAMP